MQFHSKSSLSLSPHHLPPFLSSYQLLLPSLFSLFPVPLHSDHPELSALVQTCCWELPHAAVNWSLSFLSLPLSSTLLASRRSLPLFVDDWLVETQGGIKGRTRNVEDLIPVLASHLDSEFTV